MRRGQAFLGCAGIALLLGGFIGIERQWRSQMAGLRTNVLSPSVRCSSNCWRSS